MSQKHTFGALEFICSRSELDLLAKFFLGPDGCTKHTDLNRSFNFKERSLTIKHDSPVLSRDNVCAVQILFVLLPFE